MKSQRCLVALCGSALLFGCDSSGGGADAGPACVPTGTPAVHSGTLSASETWQGVNEVDGTLTVSGGTLTIAPCSEIRLGPDVSIELSGTATALIAEGTAASPISFVRLQSAAPWGHLFATAPARISLAYATLDGAGTSTAYQSADDLGAALAVRGDPTSLPPVLKVDHVAVTHSAGLGVFMNAARFAAGSTQLSISGASFYPILLGADSLSDLPDGDYTGNATDEILLQTAGVAAAYEQGRALVADVAVHDRGVPYRVGTVPASIRVGDGYPTSPDATLTIEPGVTMRFTPQGNSGSSQILLNSVQRAGVPVAQGALVAQGTTAKPVTFTSAGDPPQAGDWQGLYFKDAVHLASRIDNALIEYAGGPSYSTGVCPWENGATDYRADASVILFLQSDQPPYSEFITNTVLSNGAGAGFYRQWQAVDVDFIPTNIFNSIAGCQQTNLADLTNLCPSTPCPSG